MYNRHTLKIIFMYSFKYYLKENMELQITKVLPGLQPGSITGAEMKEGSPTGSIRSKDFLIFTPTALWHPH